MSYLLDTNVLSELRKGRTADPGLLEWFDGIPSQDLFLSVLTVGEIRAGTERLRRRDPSGAAALNRWLSELVSRYSDRALPVDRTVAEEWGRMNARRTVPVIDGLIAATAIVKGLTVVTRNARDYVGLDVDVLNPFSRR